MTNPRPEDSTLHRYYESEAYISHSDKSLSLIDKIYKVSRNHTLKWKHNLVLKYSNRAPESILDFGCGTGGFLQVCKKAGMNIAGVEPSPAARHKAIALTDSEIATDLHQLSDTYDVITLWHVLEHISDLHNTLNKLKAFLRETGTVFIAVPNLQCWDAARYKEKWAAYDVPRHLWHFSRKTMEMILTSHSLKITAVLPMHLDAYYVSLLSEKYKTGNNNLPIMLKAFLNGWRSNREAKDNQEYSSLIYIARK
ncbi:MAG TPA: class I SAM-dependent methyltransferase [Chryseosolibacter sp.]